MFLLYDLVRIAVVTPPLMVIGSMEVRGLEHLPRSGGFIIASTHASWFDPLWLARAVKPRRIHFMAKRELFGSALAGACLTNILAFPVDRDRLAVKTAKHVRGLLTSGEIVGVFPTGTRSTTDTGPKAGVALLSVMTGAPIVPTKLTTIRHNGMRRHWRHGHVINFGPPIYEPRPASRNLKQSVERLRQTLVASLDDPLSHPRPY
jgi:1-acyl-sn-glycerol-3-phosphate acyltransferase